MQRKYLILGAIIFTGVAITASMSFLFMNTFEPLGPSKPFVLEWSHPGAFLAYKGEDVYIDFETDFSAPGEMYESYSFKDIETESEILTITVSNIYVESPDDAGIEYNDEGAAIGVPREDVINFGTFLGKNLYQLKPGVNNDTNKGEPAFFDYNEEFVDNILNIDGKSIDIRFGNEYEGLESILSGILIPKSTLQEND